jgi:hypothetical protein
MPRISDTEYNTACEQLKEYLQIVQEEREAHMKTQEYLNQHPELNQLINSMFPSCLCND